MSAPSVQYTMTSDQVAIAWAERGAGKPLVVSTGPILPLNLGWEPGGIWDRLSQSFRVVRFDPRGCGLSQRDGVFGSFHDEAADLAAVVTAIEEPRVALLGHYLGAPSAVLALLNEPERYSHLVLHLPVPLASEYNSSPSSPSALGSLSRAQLEEYSDLVDQAVTNLLRLGWKHGEEPARRALLTLIAPTAQDSTLRELADMMHSYPTYERLAQIVPEMRSLNLRDELQNVSVPTLLSIPPDTRGGFAQDWMRLFPNARLIVAQGDSPIIVHGSPAVDHLVEALEEFIGVELTRQTAGQATRTVLFTDIEESTALVDKLGDSQARQITREVESLTAQAILEHEGVQIKAMGDGVMAWFAASSTALAAAVQMQRELLEREGLSEIQLRIGLSAGEPIAEFGDLYGATVNQAARIMAEAQGGEILVSDLVRGLTLGHGYRFIDYGRRELRGFRESVQLYRVDWRSLADSDSAMALERTD